MTTPAMTAADAAGSTPKAKEDRPTQVLPTERVRFSKQLELLRAYAAVSGQASKVVNIDAVANVAKLNGSTVSLCNGFFVDVGLLERSASGGFIPSADVMQFQRAHQWAPDTAAHKLAPLLRGTWFFQRLEPKLTMGPLDRTEAIHDLADEANAAKKYESQLAMLIDYLEAAGLIRRDGDTLRMGAEPAVPSERHAAASNSTVPSYDRSPAQVVSSPAAGKAAAAMITPGVHFTIDVSVEMAEIATWGPQRITAFFEGVAKVLAAKNGTEDQAG